MERCDALGLVSRLACREPSPDTSSGEPGDRPFPNLGAGDLYFGSPPISVAFCAWSTWQALGVPLPHVPPLKYLTKFIVPRKAFGLKDLERYKR